MKEGLKTVGYFLVFMASCWTEANILVDLAGEWRNVVWVVFKLACLVFMFCWGLYIYDNAKKHAPQLWADESPKEPE